jgi:hypothetical protein
LSSNASAISSFLCGVWPGRRGLLAVVVDEYGAARPPLLVSTSCPESRSGLLDHIDGTEGLDWQLVVPDWLARGDLLAQLALAHGTAVWTVPPYLVDTVSLLGRVDRLPAHRIAAALARLPRIPFLRPALRRLRPPDQRQLSLL